VAKFSCSSIAYYRAVNDQRLSRQIAFLIQADSLKKIIRRTPLTDNSRLENSAEHSWHLALAAFVLREYAPADCDIDRVLMLVVVHDLVEIDAGDTFAYDRNPSVHASKADRERAAADRLFGILPDDQAAPLRALWDEFEAHETADARYANALDRFQALLLNSESGGGSWVTHGVTRTQVLARMAPVQAALPGLWPFVLATIDRACASGAIARE
jgi:5'-deoxynucleotidase YfbR-like HD superfamily hydrolase